jgi:hypothetical protein
MGVLLRLYTEHEINYMEFSHGSSTDNFVVTEEADLGESGLDTPALAKEQYYVKMCERGV